MGRRTLNHRPCRLKSLGRGPSSFRDSAIFERRNDFHLSSCFADLRHFFFFSFSLLPTLALLTRTPQRRNKPRPQCRIFKPSGVLLKTSDEHPVTFILKFPRDPNKEIKSCFHGQDQYTLTFLPTSLDIEAYSKAPCKSLAKSKISSFSFSNSYKTGE